MPGLWPWTGGALTAALALHLSAGCADESCVAGMSVAMDIAVVTILPWESPRPIEDADVCLEAPVRCPCARTDPGGYATIRVPMETEVLAVVRREGYVPYIGQRVIDAADVTLATRLSRVDEIELAASLVGQPLDPAAGRVGVGFLPSPGGSAAGATVELVSLADGSTYDPVYIANLVPDPAATETDEYGLALALNVPPGRYEVRSAALEDCAAIESGIERRVDGRRVAVEVDVQAGLLSGMSAVQCDIAP